MFAREAGGKREGGGERGREERESLAEEGGRERRRARGMAGVHGRSLLTQRLMQVIRPWWRE